MSVTWGIVAIVAAAIGGLLLGTFIGASLVGDALMRAVTVAHQVAAAAEHRGRRAEEALSMRERMSLADTAVRKVSGEDA